MPDNISRSILGLLTNIDIEFRPFPSAYGIQWLNKMHQRLYRMLNVTDGQQGSLSPVSTHRIPPPAQ